MTVNKTYDILIVGASAESAFISGQKVAEKINELLITQKKVNLK